MISVELFTREGGLVTTVEIPDFYIAKPQAIQWGARTFFLDTQGRYTEGFMYWVPLFPGNEAA